MSKCKFSISSIANVQIRLISVVGKTKKHVKKLRYLSLFPEEDMIYNLFWSNNDCYLGDSCLFIYLFILYENWK